jgi:hypothetical protein
MEETKPAEKPPEKPDRELKTDPKRKPLRPAPENKTIQSPENKAIATERKAYPPAEELCS